MIRIGTCGFRGSRPAYYAVLDTIEVQHTFYQPPAVKTLEGWRKEAPDGFEEIKGAKVLAVLESLPLSRVSTDEVGSPYRCTAPS